MAHGAYPARRVGELLRVAPAARRVIWPLDLRRIAFTAVAEQTGESRVIRICMEEL